MHTDVLARPPEMVMSLAFAGRWTIVSKGVLHQVVLACLTGFTSTMYFELAFANTSSPPHLFPYLLGSSLLIGLGIAAVLRGPSRSASTVAKVDDPDEARAGTDT